MLTGLDFPSRVIKGKAVWKQRFRGMIWLDERRIGRYYESRRGVWGWVTG